MKSARGFAPILIILIIGIPAVLIILYLKFKPVVPFYNTFIKTSPSPSLSVSNKPTPEPLAMADTANWKEYSSTPSKVKFKYPNTWIVQEKNGAPEDFFPSSEISSYTKLEEPTTQRKIYITPPGGYGGPMNEIDKKELFVGGLKTEKVILDGFRYMDTGDIMENTTGQLIRFNIDLSKEKNLRIYGSWEITDENADLVTDQILSTFKFTE